VESAAEVAGAEAPEQAAETGARQGPTELGEVGGRFRVMPQYPREETRAIAHLPGLDIEIVHRRPPGDAGEAIGIMLHATPSFDALSRSLFATHPLLLWAELTQAAWTAWFGAFLPPPRR
jgi:hypothetical protein